MLAIPTSNGNVSECRIPSASHNIYTILLQILGNGAAGFLNLLCAALFRSAFARSSTCETAPASRFVCGDGFGCGEATAKQKEPENISPTLRGVFSFTAFGLGYTIGRSNKSQK